MGDGGDRCVGGDRAVYSKQVQRDRRAIDILLVGLACPVCFPDPHRAHALRKWVGVGFITGGGHGMGRGG